MRLQGKVALVTGAAQRIGAACARALAAKGDVMTGQTVVVDGGSVMH